MQKNKKLLNLYPFNICTQLKHENFGVGYKSENRKFKNLLIFLEIANNENVYLFIIKVFVFFKH